MRYAKDPVSEALGATPTLEAFVTAFPEAAVAIDAAGCISLANARAGELLRLTANELVGCPIGQFVPDLAIAEDKDSTAGGRFELEALRADGARFRARVLVAPLGQGRVAIVQERMGERGSDAEPRRTSRMLDDFLATLSHELRTPLNAMIGWTQLLRIHGTDSEIGARAVETIERNIRIQTRVIEDLLDMSSLASGKLRLDIRRVSLVPIIDAAVERVAPIAREKRITLVRRIEPDVPDVLGDPRRLEQVVWNLMSNAIQFTPAGGTVTAALQRDDAGARIDVIDTGEGIDPELLPRVFDRFRQADSSSQRRHMGLGLGLAIVKSLVEMHGGEVRAESDGEGKGATFRVLLPASPVGAGEPDETRAEPARAGNVGLPSIRGVRVLVVDDHADSRDSSAGILRAAGATVFVAASAKEALAAIREHHPEVMLCDVAMPGEDGYQLMQKVRALDRREDRDLLAAALTAFTSSEDRARAIERGFQLHVSKPVEPARLVEVVAWLVRNRQG
jgi:signal transduction histidine kinase/ActR/RegA family two-component response regulator